MSENPKQTRDGETPEYHAVVDFLNSGTGAWIIRIGAALGLGLLVWQLFF